MSGGGGGENGFGGGDGDGGGGEGSGGGDGDGGGGEGIVSALVSVGSIALPTRASFSQATVSESVSSTQPSNSFMVSGVLSSVIGSPAMVGANTYDPLAGPNGRGVAEHASPRNSPFGSKNPSHPRFCETDSPSSVMVIVIVIVSGNFPPSTDPQFGTQHVSPFLPSVGSAPPGAPEMSSNVH